MVSMSMLNSPSRSTCQIDVRIEEIKIMSLGIESLEQYSNLFAIVTVGKTQKRTGEIARMTSVSEWHGNIELSVNLSSSIRVDVYDERSGFKPGGNRHLGFVTQSVMDIMKDSTPRDLQRTDGTPTAGKMAIRMTVDKPSYISAQDMVFKAADDNMRIADTRAICYQNTHPSWLEPLGEALAHMESIMEFIDGIASVHPISNAAWTLLSAVFKAFKYQIQQDEDVLCLGVRLKDMLAIAKECRDLRRIEGSTDVIMEMFHTVARGARLIDNYMQYSLMGRFMRPTVLLRIKKRIQECNDDISSLNERLKHTLGVRTLQAVLDKRHLDLLDRLPRVPADFNRGSVCLKGTRQSILHEIEAWSEAVGDKQPRIFWLHGLGGSGKTTVAATVAQWLQDERASLGASFFFSIDIADRNSTNKVFSTLAFQLSNKDPCLAQLICEAVERDKDIGSQSPLNQFYSLLKEPFKKLAAKVPTRRPIVVVLDAVDECGPDLEVRKEFLSACKEFSDFPPFFKVLITSRPERDIRSTFDSLGTSVHQCNLSNVSNHVVGSDIAKFIGSRLQEMAQQYPVSLGADWPGNAKRQALVEQSAGLFAWASTAMNFIGDTQFDDHNRRLQLLLTDRGSASPAVVLDRLYRRVLEQAYPSSDTNHVSELRIQQFQDIVGAIVTAKTPLSARALGTLLPSPTGGPAIKESVSKVGSLIAIPDSDDDSQQTLRIIHPSFGDFLTTSTRSSPPFFVDLPTHHGRLAHRCLLQLHKSLGSPVVLAGMKVSEELHYACLFWAEHVRESSDDAAQQLYADLRLFFTQGSSCSNWIQVTARLLSAIDDVDVALTVIGEWIARRNPRDGLLPLIADAMKMLDTLSDTCYGSSLSLSSDNSVETVRRHRTVSPSESRRTISLFSTDAVESYQDRAASTSGGNTHAAAIADLPNVQSKKKWRVREVLRQHAQAMGRRASMTSQLHMLR